MWYTHYMYYDRTKVDPANSKLDSDRLPESDLFRKKWDKLTQIVYDICYEAMKRWIALGNGMWKFWPEISNRIVLNWSVRQYANQRTRLPKPMEVNKTEEFAWKLGAAVGAGAAVLMWNWLQRPDDSFLDWDWKSERTGSWFAGSSLNAPSIPNPENKSEVDWSYESLFIENSMVQADYRANEKEVFTCTKTNFYPYDIVVTAVMAATQLIMGKDAVKVSSDWQKKDRMRGLLLLKSVSDLDVKQFYLEWEEKEKTS